MSSLSLPIGAIEIRLMPKIDLDPKLLNYWENFPCPPPWNNGLLYKVNWTNCHVSQEVGVQLRDLMVEKCATYSNVQVVAREVGRGYLFQSCSMECKLIISAVCFLLGLLLVAGISLCIRRKRRQKTDFSPTHETALNSSSDRKYYTSCMRGNSPVIKKKGKKDSGMDIMLLERENFQNLYTEPETMTAEQQLVDQEYHDTLNQQLIKLAQMAENRFSDSLKKQKSEANRTSSGDVVHRVTSRDKIHTSISSELIKKIKRLSRDSSMFRNEPMITENRLSCDSSLFLREPIRDSEDCIPSTSRKIVELSLNFASTRK
ncbi:hypothetical protein LOTGIDRAFT_159942 [Lottia gigantea]|uniref:Uncharacterized protein n=1 Tax=Lottia gigantea TaxID=225164 RepID=V4AS35_LOTGI|nr:hypothetical protein LOTGIDRAFT_159942 [Lottia gigantea]ESO96526.1 hypothetical protein LOTGIDRAFT_159942 [Lottia gigantea]